MKGLISLKTSPVIIVAYMLLVTPLIMDHILLSAAQNALTSLGRLNRNYHANSLSTN